MRNSDTLNSITRKGHIVKFHRDNFIIFAKKNCGFIIWNTDMEFEENKATGHSHLKSYTQAKIICNNILNDKYPNSISNYLWNAYFRVLPDDNEYKIKLLELYETKKDKLKGNQKDYININKGSKR